MKGTFKKYFSGNFLAKYNIGFKKMNLIFRNSQVHMSCRVKSFSNICNFFTICRIRNYLKYLITKFRTQINIFKYALLIYK